MDASEDVGSAESPEPLRLDKTALLFHRKNWHFSHIYKSTEMSSSQGSGHLLLDIRQATEVKSQPN